MWSGPGPPLDLDGDDVFDLMVTISRPTPRPFAAPTAEILALEKELVSDGLMSVEDILVHLDWEERRELYIVLYYLCDAAGCSTCITPPAPFQAEKLLQHNTTKQNTTQHHTTGAATMGGLPTEPGIRGVFGLHEACTAANTPAEGSVGL